MLTIDRERDQVSASRRTVAEGSASQAARQRMITHERGGLIRADWLNMVFLHLEVEPEVLQRHTPFEIDLFKGRAFVSLVAFVMRRFRPRGTGALGSWLCAPVARHSFLNVRTYVLHRDEPGIVFLTEWVSNPLSVVFGLRTYGLPYRFGRLKYEHDFARGEWHGMVTARNRAATLKYHAAIQPPAGVRPTGSDYRHNLIHKPAFGAHAAGAGSLDEFLLERYTAFTHHRGIDRHFRIWHQPWRYSDLSTSIEDDSLLGLTAPWLREARLVSSHYSPGVRDVWIGASRKVQS